MQLSKQQIHQFDKEGYLFLPELFSTDEIAALRSEAEAIFRTDRKEIWREKSGSPRTWPRLRPHWRRRAHSAPRGRRSGFSRGRSPGQSRE